MGFHTISAAGGVRAKSQEDISLGKFACYTIMRFKVWIPNFHIKARHGSKVAQR